MMKKAKKRFLSSSPRIYSKAYNRTIGHITEIITANTFAMPSTPKFTAKPRVKL